MRLQPLPVPQLDSDQRKLYDQMQSFLGGQDRGFVTARADGAMVGPYNLMLHFPQFGEAVWNLITALGKRATLAAGIRELAMLCVGAHFSARYEIYAHEQSGARHGLSAPKIATLAAGTKPADLSSEENAAFDVVKAVVAGGQLPESTYQQALETFGLEGTAELLYLTGTYCLVSVLLNGYDVPVPDRDTMGNSAQGDRE